MSMFLSDDALKSPSVGATFIGHAGEMKLNDTRLPGMPAVKRGYMRRDPKNPSDGARYNFLFNPQFIDTSINFDVTSTQPPVPGLTPPLISGGSSCQIGLYIDRQNGVSPPTYKAMGAMYDIQYMQRLLGINTLISNDTAINSSFITQAGVAMIFGAALQINGWVTGMAIRYEKFNPDMTPVVATVTLTVQLLYAGTATSAAVPTPIGVIGSPNTSGLPGINGKTGGGGSF